MGDKKAPVFKKKPAIRQEEDGDRLLFECIIEANPTPTISWFRDEKPVAAQGRFKIKCDRKGDDYHCALVIDDVEEEDGGKYKVTATNNLGESSATINLNFDTEEDEEEEGLPVFTGKPVIKQSPDFNSIIFECNLTADPKPTLQWFHNGKPISEGGRYKSLLKATSSGFLATLEIAQVGSADGGEYKVIAKNSVGEGSAAINLNFEG
ncbi:Twitchin, partial [Stegodyphus mimosarum]